MEVDRNGLEVLDRDECLRLLGKATLGRVGLTHGALPTILPVNFRVVDEHIVFRTSRGTKLDAATRNTVVAFEVDEIDAFAHTGWSVVLTGVAREVADLRELAGEARAADELLRIPRWAPHADEDDRIVAITIEIVSGRRIVPGTGVRPPMDLAR